MKKLSSIIIMCLIAQSIFAQDVSILQTVVINGDTILLSSFPEFSVEAARAPKVFASKKEEEKYNKLKEDVTKVYPYAKLAGDLLNGYNEELAHIKTKKQKRAFTKKIEEEIESEFGSELGHLSVNQQVILIKIG